jgi:phosphate transport system protein
MNAPRTTSPAASADAGDAGEVGATVPARSSYRAELDQLRIQVELMGVRVDQNLERMRTVLLHGDAREAEHALAADDEIDAMQVSLTERCYDLLAREQPVASDLRLIVSVVRITAELERVGDLALRVVKLAPDHELLRRSDQIFDLLAALADLALDHYRLALRAFATQSLVVADEAATTSAEVGHLSDRLVGEVHRLEGDDAVAVAVKAMAAGQALSRIDDHATVLGARLRYLFTGDPDHLAAEVR